MAARRRRKLGRHGDRRRSAHRSRAASLAKTAASAPGHDAMAAAGSSRPQQALRRPARGEGRVVYDRAAARSSASSALTAPARPRCYNLLTGFIPPDGGSIVFEGRRPARAGAVSHRRSSGISRTFQLCRPFVGMSVLENVIVGALGRAAATARRARGARARRCSRRSAWPARSTLPVEVLLLRRPAPARDRARAGGRPGAAAARRALRRPGQRRDRRPVGADPQRPSPNRGSR